MLFNTEWDRFDKLDDKHVKRDVSNRAMIERVYYDYHGKHDDGNHVADEVEMTLGGGYAW